MRRSGSLLGVLGLVCLFFGLGAYLFILGSHWFVVANLTAGVLAIIAWAAAGWEDVRAVLAQRSTRYGAGTLVYSVLFLVLLVGLNFVLARHHHRFDVTEAGVYTLSPQSRRVLGRLKEDLVFTAFVEGGRDEQLANLLDSYRYASSRVKVRMVDPDREPGLAEQMHITTLRSVHVRYGKESTVVTEPSEEKLTNAIIRVTSTKKKVVYYVTGHGENPLDAVQDPRGFSAAKEALQNENYEVKELVLPTVNKVPDDASVVVIAGPKRPLRDYEVSALDSYLRRGGRLLAMLGPRQGTKLEKLLADWGVKLGHDIVIDRELRLFQGPRLGVTPITKSYGYHPITEDFRDYTIFPETRSVSPDATGKKGISATTLVRTGRTSWAETDLDGVFKQHRAALDPNDRRGPISIAVAVTAKLRDMGIDHDGEARLVVVGTPLFADNQNLVATRPNRDLFLNAAGWLVGQEELVSIRPRSIRASRADLTPAQVFNVFFLSVLLLPELLIGAGLAVWWSRRSR